MKIKRTDIVLAVAMLTSLIALHVIRVFSVGSRLWNESFVVPPIVLPIFFLYPLCQGFMQGMAAARDSTGAGARESPASRFRAVFRPRVRLWWALWGLYIVVLQSYFFTFAGLAGLLVTVPSAGLPLLMATSCLVWAPRCKKPWTLMLLTLLTGPLFFGLVFCLLFAGIALLGQAGIIDLGYMDMGLAILPPLAALVLLIIAAVGVWVWALRQGDAWFRI